VTTRHVVIVGYGMAGARLAEELRRRDPVAARLRITVLGAEPDAPYNRILLADVLSGALAPDRVRLYPAGWAHRHQVAVHRGAPVVAVDPGRRELTTADNTVHTYDDLVLATGARPRFPTLPGLTTPTGAPTGGVSPLRTLADTRHLLSLTDPTDGPGQVVVLGGGVLGLEAARALAGRGLAVTVVHPPGYLMNRQLDAAAGRLLARTLRGLGVRVRLGESAARWEPGDADGDGRALVTDRGTVLPCRAVVVAAGAVPDTDLARDAGVAVAEGGGVVVDDRLATSVPGIWALGDCARHGGAPGGFVAPAWEQAAVLADLLSGVDPAARYRGSRAVTRLKDRDIHLTALGDAALADHDADHHPDEHDAGPDAGHDAGAEIVVVSEPARGRYAKLVVRDGRVAGAIMLGVPDAAAGVIQLFDRDEPVPDDRLAVLLGRAYPDGAVGGADPAGLPDDSVVCRCNTVTKGALATAWRAGATGVTELATATRATTGCGSCTSTVAALCAGLRRDGTAADERDGEGVA
jgi:assimilatory nitrate reductase electron transfer subunit